MGTGAYFGCLSFLNPATIHNWTNFATKDSNADYIRPYEDRTHNTTNGCPPGSLAEFDAGLHR